MRFVSVEGRRLFEREECRSRMAADSHSQEAKLPERSDSLRQLEKICGELARGFLRQRASPTRSPLKKIVAAAQEDF